MVESQPPNNPAPSLSPLLGTFVGRQQELASLKAALEDALSGHGAGAETHARELAHHFSEAQTILGPEKLVHYSSLAGERHGAGRGTSSAPSWRAASSFPCL